MRRNPTPRSTPQSQFASEQAAAQLYELWLPLEERIQRSTGEEAADGKNAPLSGLRNDEARRALLHKLFEERESGHRGARLVVESFSDLLRLYAGETQRLLDAGGYSQQNAEESALNNLSGDADFLQKANAYANFYQAWLIDTSPLLSALFFLSPFPGRHCSAFTPMAPTASLRGNVF